MLTGGSAPDRLAEALRTALPPDVHLLLVRADAGVPTAVTGARGVRLMSLRVLDELPRAIRAAAPKVLT